MDMSSFYSPGDAYRAQVRDRALLVRVDVRAGRGYRELSGFPAVVLGDRSLRARSPHHPGPARRLLPWPAYPRLHAESQARAGADRAPVRRWAVQAVRRRVALLAPGRGGLQDRARA